MEIPQFKDLRRSYGFDEISIAPGQITINPDQTNLDFSVGDVKLTTPVLAAAMDAVVSPEFAVSFDRLGGLAVINLEGVQVRYKNPGKVIDEIIDAPDQDVTSLFQRVYSEPIKEDLIGLRIGAIKAQGAKCAVAMTPANTKRFAPLAVESGADLQFSRTFSSRFLASLVADRRRREPPLVCRWSGCGRIKFRAVA